MLGSLLRWPWSLTIQVNLLGGADAAMESKWRATVPLQSGRLNMVKYRLRMKRTVQADIIRLGGHRFSARR
jgi:hypothetical protein